MKKAYIIKIEGSNIAIFVRYFENGFIESYHYQTPADPPEQAQAAIKKHFPFYITDLKFYKENKKVFDVKPVTPDLSFKKLGYLRTQTRQKSTCRTAVETIIAHRKGKSFGIYQEV